jgi:hypothetical protein
MIFNHVKEGLVLSIFTYFILIQAKLKLTKNKQKSSYLYSLLLLYPAGGNNLLLLRPAGGNSLFLLQPADDNSL